jgi:hypothetical protein
MQTILDPAGETFNLAVNFTRIRCEWCGSPALYAVTELSTRTEPWTDYVCPEHRETWFTGTVLRCAVPQCTEHTVKPYMTGSASPTGWRKAFEACRTHRASVAELLGGAFLSHRRDYDNAINV